MGSDPFFAIDPFSQLALSGDALFDDAIHYANLGDHRAGTPIDRQTSEWIADELKNVGYETELQPWSLRQFILEECVLKVDGKWIDCFPFWYPKATGPKPVTGTLAPLSKDIGPGELAGKITFVDGNNLGVRILSAGVNSLAEQAADAGYQTFGFFGGHHYFHTRHDTPATTEPRFLEAVGSGLARVITKLDAEDAVRAK